MNNRDNRHPKGAGRRTYPNAAGADNGPRVGRIERNVPRARQVSADEDYSEQATPAYTGNSNSTLHSPHSTLSSSHASLHRGSAYRAPTGPRQYKREQDAGADLNGLDVPLLAHPADGGAGDTEHFCGFIQVNFPVPAAGIRARTC